MFHSSGRLFRCRAGATYRFDVMTRSTTIPAGLPVADTGVDLLVVGSGTGMAAALTAHESGLSALIVEKSSYVGGSTARSGGALWLPASPVLAEADAGDTAERAGAYLDSVVAGSAPAPLIRQVPRARVGDRGHAAPHDAAAAVLGPRLFDYHPRSPAAARPGAPANAARSTPRCSASTAPGWSPA